jgi:DNA replication protein DnaC
VAGVVLDKGYDVIYVSSPNFFSRLEDLRFGDDPNGERDALMETALNADLLILDDLGTEFNSQYLLSALYTLLNTRLGAHRPTIITTNIMDGAVLEKRYTEKISSRIAAFVPFRFLGQDVRAAKAAEDV